MSYRASYHSLDALANLRLNTMWGGRRGDGGYPLAYMYSDPLYIMSHSHFNKIFFWRHVLMFLSTDLEYYLQNYTFCISLHNIR
jgi:hypothetical protein